MRVNHKPIARCEANGVAAYQYPFYAKGTEPYHIFLEDHLHSFTSEERKGLMHHFTRIDKDQGWQDPGNGRNREGGYVCQDLRAPGCKEKNRD